MKKALSLILAISIIFCALPVMGISAEETASDKFTVTSAKAETTTISGDDVSGYTMAVNGTGLTRVMTKETYPMKNLSFDYGYNRSNPGSAYGEFGITMDDDIDTAPTKSSANSLTFRYYPGSGSSGNRLDIYVVWSDNSSRLIGSFDFATYRPGDGYWNPNVSNFQLVLDNDGVVRLAVDGNLCTNSDYSKLSIVFNKNNLINNEKAHIFVGGYNAAGTGTAYFKQLSSLSEDGAWESRAVDSFVYESYEYRGQGNRDTTVHSAIPATATGTKHSGHVVDFTGTNGYAQTTEGFNLKTTKFKVSPRLETLPAEAFYYLGFTTNPSIIQHHSVKPGDSVEFKISSVLITGQNATYGRVITNTGCLAEPTTADSDVLRWGYRTAYDNNTAYATAPMEIDFVEDTGADGELHWYMRTKISGEYKIVKGTTDTDKYFQFDNIIDKPVYFRMGTHKKASSNFTMFCDIDNTADGSTAWSLPELSAEETALVAEVQAGIAELSGITAETVDANYESGLALIKKYDALSEDALEHITDAEKATFESIRAVVEAFIPLYVNSAKAETTTVTGDEVDGYKIAVNGTGLTSVMTRETYPIANLSFDYGYQRTNVGSSYGEFGVTTKDSVDDLTGRSGSDTLTFRYYAAAGTTGNRLDIYVVWSDSNQGRLIGQFDFATYRPADGYWNPNVSNFSFVKVDGHWRLAVDGNICDISDYSCLEYDGRASFFESNSDVHIYVGGYHAAGTGTAYFKPLTTVSEDGMWESTAVDSYIYNSTYEYRGQGNRDTTVHSAIPAIATGTKEDGHVVDFTGTNGYAQTANGYDLKTTKFKVAPRLETLPAEAFYYLGFTADPSNIQHHSVKPGDSIEFKISSVLITGQNATYGRVITNTGCLAEPTTADSDVLRWGYRTAYDNNTEYTTALMEIDFVKDTGADGELHWYMRTKISGEYKIVKGTADNDAYFQFDNIIDKPVYFRMGTHKMATSNFSMYCKIDGDVITDSALYTDIVSEDYLVNYEDGAVIDGNEYAYCDTIGEVGEYSIEYTASGIKRVRKLVLYKASDVNADNEVDIRDLVALKKNIVGIRELSTVGAKSADLNDDGKIDSLDLTNVRKVLLGVFSLTEQIPDASAPIENVLYVKDFGAVGDGVTDDGEAIYAAMTALAEAGDNSKLVFEADKTYYYNDDGASVNSVLQLEDSVNVHIEGDNTTIVTEAPMGYARFTDTVGCSISGFNFDYGKRPYFMAENATQVDKAAGTCVMEIGEGMAESYLGLTEVGQTVTIVDNGGGIAAGHIESDTGRYHMYLNKYELVGTDKIKIYFVMSANENMEGWLDNQLEGFLGFGKKRLICPTPGVGHAVEHATHFSGNRDLTLKDINVYSACKFVSAIMKSEGTVVIDNFDMTPNPALAGTFEETDFTAFRDGWHCKENRAQIIWRNCDATGLYDDIINVSSSVMWVKEVQAANRINMYWNETGGAFRADLKKGDELTIIDTDTGLIIAETTISRVVKQSGSDNIVILEDELDLTAGQNIQVLFENLVAPNSIVENCNFDGTFRFRGPITVKDSTFNCRMMWIDTYSAFGGLCEGPVPHDILFNNCKFTFENTNKTYVYASAYNENVSENSYHLKNIVFEDCVVNEDNFEIGTGDEVIFKNCTAK